MLLSITPNEIQAISAFSTSLAAIASVFGLFVSIKIANCTNKPSFEVDMSYWWQSDDITNEFLIIVVNNTGLLKLHFFDVTMFDARWPFQEKIMLRSDTLKSFDLEPLKSNWLLTSFIKSQMHQQIFEKIRRGS